MSKPTPLLYGKYYHIYNRGNNRENVFIEERNYSYFLALYSKYVLPVADTYAYCLLRNHFHFLVRIRDKVELEKDSNDLRIHSRLKILNPSHQFGNLFDAYAKAINKAYGRTGSLFQHPFGRIQVSTDEYFAYLVTYIHQNPEKHGLIGDFRQWPHSSYGAISSNMQTHIKKDDVLERFQSLANFRIAHELTTPSRRIIGLAPDDFD